MSVNTLNAENLCLRYGKKVIAKGVNLDFSKPEIISIMGPNGSGKSTILKALGNLLEPSMGVVQLNGEDMRNLDSNKIAKIISVLPQSAIAPGDLRIYDLVMYGRMPHRGFFASVSEADRIAVQSALEATGLQHLQDRRIDSVSGGERQRAWLAMAIAQEPEILLLDEPTTYLDVHHQLELMELVANLHHKRQLTVIMVLHDLNHAARYSQRIIAVKEGRIIANGSVEEVFTEQTLENLYGVKAVIKNLEHQGIKYPIYFPYSVSANF